MNKKILFLLAFISVILLVGCGGGQSSSDVDIANKPIVSVDGRTLYASDIADIYTPGLSKEDSAKVTDAYVRMWIDDQLMYEKARKNLVNEKEIERLVEDYRKSLIVNSYQDQLMQEQLMKSVSDKDLQAYYSEHKEMFKLDEPIIKGLYLKIPAKSPALANFQRWYKSMSDAAIENIEKNQLQNAVGYEYFYDRWVSFTDIMDNVPLLINDNEQFLKSNASVEVSDSSFVYLLNIKEYRLSGSEPPYDYIKNRLSEVFMEHRKFDFLKKVQSDLYNKALSDKKIKFYNK